MNQNYAPHKFSQNGAHLFHFTTEEPYDFLKQFTREEYLSRLEILNSPTEEFINSYKNMRIIEEYFNKKIEPKIIKLIGENLSGFDIKVAFHPKTGNENLFALYGDKDKNSHFTKMSVLAETNSIDWFQKVVGRFMLGKSLSTFSRNNDEYR